MVTFPGYTGLCVDNLCFQSIELLFPSGIAFDIPEVKRPGVAMTDRELHNVLERFGIKPIIPEGERFNPNLHQAMFEVEDPSVPSGTVMQVAQKGYSIGERVLRPALVGVSKGGPKPQRPQEAAQPQSSANQEETKPEQDLSENVDQSENQTEQPGNRIDREA